MPIHFSSTHCVLFSTSVYVKRIVVVINHSLRAASVCVRATDRMERVKRCTEVILERKTVREKVVYFCERLYSLNK